MATVPGNGVLLNAGVATREGRIPGDAVLLSTGVATREARKPGDAVVLNSGVAVEFASKPGGAATLNPGVAVEFASKAGGSVALNTGVSTVVDYTPPAAEPSPTVILETVEVLSQNTLLLTFSESMLNNDTLNSAESYTITALGSGISVNVKSVLNGSGNFTTEVVIDVTSPMLGEEYEVEVVGDVRGAAFTSMNPSFESRMTKLDYVLHRLPRLYTKDQGSTLRTIFQAITREDDKIGGNRDDFLS